MWEEGISKNLITLYDEEHNKELNEHIKSNNRVIPEIKEQLIMIVKKFWDYFVEPRPEYSVPYRKLKVIRAKPQSMTKKCHTVRRLNRPRQYIM